MAIVQISRITNRKGLIDDLPAPLAGAEFGWATNTRQLFIGNGTVEEGAPVVGNTEILTEFTDIFQLKSGYTYKGEAGGYLVITGADADSPVIQSLQDRLDSYAVATDFGIVGDGFTDNTVAINRAMYQLYCRDSVNPATRRGLFFPAGRYIVTGTLNIPTWANLYGDSMGGSVIDFQTRVWSNLVAYAPGITVEHEGAYYISLVPVPPGTGLGDLDYWQLTTQPMYVLRTADSNQSIGTAIGAGDGTTPRKISVTDMTFVTEAAISALLMEDVTDTVFTNVTMIGPLDLTTISDVSPDISAVRWSSTPIYVSTNNQFINCTFRGFRTGTYGDVPIAGNSFKGCSFNTLYQGVYFSVSDPLYGGATGTRIVGNTFDNIYHQGILLEGVSLNASGQNIFYDVGNEFNGTSNPVTAVIDFDGDNNVSVSDMFERSDAVVKASHIARIDLHNRVSIGVENGSLLKLGSYDRTSGVIATLQDATTEGVLFTFDTTDARAIAFDYTVLREVGVRSGRFTVVSSIDGGGTGLVFTDSGTENSDVGVSFGAYEVLGIVSVVYNTTAIASNAQLSYSITKLA